MRSAFSPLEGWIDAGYVAGSARQLLLDRLTTEPVARFDADDLLDHRARRPVMHLVDGVNTGLTWPSIELSAATDLAGNDLLVLHGAEPDHSWRAFTSAVVDLALGLEVRLIVGLGAYPAPTPHTRPTMLSVTAGTDELAETSELLRGTLDVPAGVQAAIEHHATEVGIPTLGLWAQVPHYAAGMSYPAGVLALLEQVQRVSGLTLPEDGLAEEALASRNRLDSIIAGNPEHQDMVSALEREVDAQAPVGPPANLPTGDELAAEVERFLRDQSSGE